jgi:WD40 repeat protein
VGCVRCTALSSAASQDLDVMTDSDSFSPSQVWFKPLNNLHINVGESLLTVCVPPMGDSILTGGETQLIYACNPTDSQPGLGLTIGTAGVIKVWDVRSGKLQMNIHVGSVILKMLWISLTNARTAFVVGLDDGSILLYLYWAPSHLSKFRNWALGLLPFSFVGSL